MKISDYLKPEFCIMELKASAKDEVIREIASVLAKSPMVKDTEKFIADILERERLGSTGIGNNVAIPHSPTESVDGFVIAFARCADGIDFQSLDGEKVSLIFMMGTSPQELNLYLKLLAKLSKLLIESSFRRELLSAATPQQIIDTFRRFETE